MQNRSRTEPSQYRCDLLDLRVNGGKGEAIRRGMLHLATLPAYEEIEWVERWDADLSAPLFEVANFLRDAPEWGGSDVQGSSVAGSNGWAAGIERSFLRHILGGGFATLVGFLRYLHPYDSQSGAKLFRKAHIEKLFSEQFVPRWIFDLELLFQLAPHPAIEYPVTEWKDAPSSRVRILREGFRVVHEFHLIKKKYKDLPA